jgi:hypothetical protein
MKILAMFWVVCYLGFYALTLIIVAASVIWFQQLEKAYPEVFDHSHYLVSRSKRLWRYWSYILAGNYADLDEPKHRSKCAVLRVLLWVYLIDLTIAFAGIFIVRPA